ncbi:hypothetical protein B0O99DRAFT_739984 [Bisporella sp. PMI_857]|nr:hypothetical protein B0O99DRAFT_739984 [Bisporella sp. PMI_857]
MEGSATFKGFDINSMLSGVSKWSPSTLTQTQKLTLSSTYNDPPTAFPAPIPPPIDLPLRPTPQIPALEKLDAVHNNPSSQIILNDGNDLEQQQQAYKKFQQHIKGRVPYAQLASSRLQAAIGLNNTNTFDLPEMPKSTYEPYGLRVPLLAPAPKNGLVWLRKKDSGVNLGRDGGPGGLKAALPLGMDNGIDKETGNGLREFLLAKGKEYGMRKLECRSISFHDFTPDLHTMVYRNVLLGHYAVTGVSDRADVYEVDLPTTNLDSKGNEVKGTQTWIWILIQRPVISIDASEKSTYVAPPTLKAGDGGLVDLDEQNLRTDRNFKIEDNTETSDENEAKLEQNAVPRPPPNFPAPIPLSWVVIAAPLDHVTQHPITADSTSRKPSMAAQFLKKQKRSNKKTGYMECKRADYDFSHAGVPIFEFSSAELFSTPFASFVEEQKGSHKEDNRENPVKIMPIPFLSVENIGPFSQYDQYLPYTPTQFQQVRNLFTQGFQETKGSCPSKPEASEGVGGGVIENGGAGGPSFYRGIWWDTFWREMYHDATRWRDVKRAMARGRCRVVVRWVEWVGGGDEDDSEIDALLECIEKSERSDLIEVLIGKDVGGHGSGGLGDLSGVGVEKEANAVLEDGNAADTGPVKASGTPSSRRRAGGGNGKKVKRKR